MFSCFLQKPLFLFLIVVIWFVSAPDPHEDDARSHVPSADSAGATCLHLNTLITSLTLSLLLSGHLSVVLNPLSPLCILFDIT